MYSRQSDAYLAIVPKTVKNLRPSEGKIESSSFDIVEFSARAISSDSIPVSISPSTSLRTYFRFDTYGSCASNSHNALESMGRVDYGDIQVVPDSKLLKTCSGIVAPERQHKSLLS